ncbi:MAG: hypothetical protein O2865_16360 [Planctomycetota bacterium]|nr:hypothetical protein [Planctomycetota bacterium]MDA0933394.1 hypothetical protein [Planctomycetota bacterium]
MQIAVAVPRTAQALARALVAIGGAQLAATVAVAQQDPELTRFRELGFRQKAAIIRAIERSLDGIDNPLLARLRDWRYDVETLPSASGAPPIHDPARYAKAEHEAGRAPSRTVIAATETAHQAVNQRFARPAFLPDLIAEVRYDWGIGQVVRGPALGYDELFANALHGYAPGTDHVVARVLAALDQDDEQRKLAAWFGHAYCDLEARAFPPVTFYDAWYSGRTVDVPDVDAIPFAWEILGWKRYRSPLSGPPRDRLYDAIRDAALRQRVHRTQCEAAAAAAVCAEPRMDPMYALLVPRFHFLWQDVDDDLDALVDRLQSKDRGALLEEVDQRIREPSGTAYERRELRRRELADLAAQVRDLARAALARFGGTH